MTDEDRLVRLEKQAENLRLVSSGNGFLLRTTKFEKQHDTVADRIAHLENWTKNFRISGKGVKAFGSFKTGYCVTCEPAAPSEGIGPAPTPVPPVSTGACCVGEDCSITTEAECATIEGSYQGNDTTCDPNPCNPICPICPDLDSITVVVSDIVSCGCELGFGGENSELATDLGINGTYILDRVSPTEWKTSGIMAIDLKTWLSNNTCSGSPDFESTRDMTIRVQCASGHWQVDIFDTNGGVTAFSGGVTTDNPVDNIVVCGAFLGNLLHNGTVLILCPTTGACCVDGVCSIQTESDCVSMGGEFKGLGVDCDPYPCI